jgi:hypothetical protein
MSLPKNALYTNNIESSFARNYQANIAPTNGLGPYSTGETIMFSIPTQRNTVMSGADSILKFDLTVTNGATINNYIRLDKAGASSLISRIRIFHGSTLLEDIQNYNNLVAMLNSVQVSADGFKGKGNILEGMASESVVNSTDNVAEQLLTGERLADDIDPYNPIAANATTLSRTYCINLMTILSSDKYVPLFALNGAALRIEIQLVSSVAEGVCSHLPVASMQLKNVEYVANMMELSDQGMAMVSSAAGGQLKWVCSTYKNFSHTANVAASTELSVSIPAKFNSLRSLFWSMRTSAHVSGTVTYYPLASHHYGLDSYFVRLGSKTVPAKAPDRVPQFFAELIRGIGSISDLNHQPNISMKTYDVDDAIANTETDVSTDRTAQSSAFYLGLDLESYSSAGMNEVFQGYNSSTDDILFTPKFKSTAPTEVIRIDTYALHDQVIVIDSGFASVQY